MKGVLKMADKKSRYWAAILYPDSVDIKSSIERLYSLHIPCFLSPLHQPDEEDKKEHYHIMMLYDGPVTFSLAQTDFNYVGENGITIPKYIRSKVGYARYLCHLDENGRKPIYNTDDVLCFAGADYDSVIEEASDVVSEIDLMLDYIDKYRCFKFASFLSYCRLFNKKWFRLLLTRNSYINLIKSYQSDLAADEWSDFHKDLF